MYAYICLKAYVFFERKLNNFLAIASRGSYFRNRKGAKIRNVVFMQERAVHALSFKLHGLVSFASPYLNSPNSGCVLRHLAPLGSSRAEHYFFLLAFPR